MAVQIQFRRGTSAQWTAANPVLALGEPGYEIDTGNFKVGDGINPWASLPYSSGPMGANGTNSYVSIGTTTVLPPGASPTVTDSDPSANVTVKERMGFIPGF